MSIQSVDGHLRPILFPPSLERRQGNTISTEIKDQTKYCGVCGDVTKSFHFGGLCCNSCKSFFRRSILKDNYHEFFCSKEGRCVLSVSNRKNCRYCRMSRCFAIGMNKSWLWTEEQREVFTKNRAHAKLIKQVTDHPESSSFVGTLLYSYSGFPKSLSCSRQQSYQPRIGDMICFLSIVEIKEIELIVANYSQAYHSVPYRDDLPSSRNQCQSKARDQVMEMLGTFISRLQYYSQLMADFSSLPFQDQNILLRDGIMEMFLLRVAFVFDPTKNCWPNKNLPMYRNSPVLYLSDIKQLTSPRLHQMNVDFIYWIQQVGVDEPTVMLLIMIVLFTPDRVGVSRKTTVEKFQLHYITLLDHYMKWRFGPDRYKSLFGKLLIKLSDLRELSDSYDSQNLLLSNEEIQCIQKRMQNLEIKPFFTFVPSLDPNGSSACAQGTIIDSYSSLGRSLTNVGQEFNFSSVSQETVSCFNEETIVDPDDSSQLNWIVDEEIVDLFKIDILSTIASPSSSASFESTDFPSSTNTDVSNDRKMIPSPNTMRLLFEELDQCQFEL